MTRKKVNNNRSVSSAKPPALLTPTSSSAISISPTISQASIDSTPLTVSAHKERRTGSESSRLTRTGSIASSAEAQFVNALASTPQDLESLPTSVLTPPPLSSSSDSASRLRERLDLDAISRKRQTEKEESRKLRKKRPEVVNGERSRSASILSYETSENVENDGGEGNRSNEMNEVSIEEEVIEPEVVRNEDSRLSHSSITKLPALSTKEGNSSSSKQIINLVLLPYKILYRISLLPIKIVLLPLHLANLAISDLLTTPDPTKFEVEDPNPAIKHTGILRNTHVEDAVGVGIAGVCIVLVSLEWTWRRIQRKSANSTSF